MAHFAKIHRVRYIENVNNRPGTYTLGKSTKLFVNVMSNFFSGVFMMEPGSGCGIVYEKKLTLFA